MAYPTKMEVNGHVYNINTNYKIALACLKAVEDDEITEIQRYYAIETLLLGPEVDEYDEIPLQEKIAKYLRCGREENTREEEIDFDYFQDESAIRSSLRQCYKLTPEEIDKLSWYEYNELLENLTEDTSLNRIRDLRTRDPNEIKDAKQRNELIRAKERVALRPKEHKRTEKEERSVERFYRQAKVERK